MSDQSQLDSRYFLDQYVYNCPFCNRRSVSYGVIQRFHFHWTLGKECFGYVVRCNSCNKGSMHLTYADINTYRADDQFRFSIPDDAPPDFLDRIFFYSVPTSFFVLDNRVPKKLRELLTEAEGCLKSNFLTGASACARKMIYELAVLEDASGDNYEDRIKSLKTKHPAVPPEFFDTLLTVQKVTNSKVHENSNDAWEARHLRIILATLREVLHEIYVVPALREDRRKAVLTLQDELLPKPKAPKGTLA